MKTIFFVLSVSGAFNFIATMLFLKLVEKKQTSLAFNFVCLTVSYFFNVLLTTAIILWFGLLCLTAIVKHKKISEILKNASS